MTEDIKQVKARHEQVLLAKPGVVSVGIGLDDHSEQAIIVGLEKIEGGVPAELPTELEGYPVIVREVGSIKTE